MSNINSSRTSIPPYESISNLINSEGQESPEYSVYSQLPENYATALELESELFDRTEKLPIERLRIIADQYNYIQETNPEIAQAIRERARAEFELMGTFSRAEKLPEEEELLEYFFGSSDYVPKP